MGRWPGIQYQMKQDRSLFLISAHRPYIYLISENVVINSNSTHAQHFPALRRDTSPNPRKQFVLDLIQYNIKLELKEKDTFLIMLDANESFGRERPGISHLAATD